MKCISSPALDDTQIMRYVDGEADDTVVAHIKECPYCAEKASQWTLLQNRLKKQLFRSACPTPMELGDYHLGLLPAPQALVIAQHLRECPLCRREVAELEEFLAESPPQTNFLESAKVIIARLLGEQAGEPSFAALRGEAKGSMTFEADGIVIILDVQPSNEGKVNILGQVAADDQDPWTGAKVELEQADSSRLTASMDDLGAFHFEDVSPGVIQITIKSLYSLQVQIPNIEITI